ncbi:hypothetical protein EGR_04672 [Echinococcus granulosus]|uniref:Uncharacterized protein n=1 Tax=Echinococcus granulosus TaxID=6210 RepID=W6UHD6_ECHGR|nr:hypothetical protein EGR_04672 [Echinococcus granulosus]EUB60478.1 hypothetical protein EGR_04672 [Echinococcus granulosus]
MQYNKDWKIIKRIYKMITMKSQKINQKVNLFPLASQYFCPSCLHGEHSRKICFAYNNTYFIIAVKMRYAWAEVVLAHFRSRCLEYFQELKKKKWKHKRKISNKQFEFRSDNNKTIKYILSAKPFYLEVSGNVQLVSITIKTFELTAWVFQLKFQMIVIFKKKYCGFLFQFKKNVYSKIVFESKIWVRYLGRSRRPANIEVILLLLFVFIYFAMPQLFVQLIVWVSGRLFFCPITKPFSWKKALLIVSNHFCLLCNFYFSCACPSTRYLLTHSNLFNLLEQPFMKRIFLFFHSIFMNNTEFHAQTCAALFNGHSRSLQLIARTDGHKNHLRDKSASKVGFSSNNKQIFNSRNINYKTFCHFGAFL